MRVAEMCQEGCLGCVEEVVFQMCGCSQQLCDGCKLVQDGCMQRDEVNKYNDEQACLTEKKKKLTQVQKSLKKAEAVKMKVASKLESAMQYVQEAKASKGYDRKHAKLIVNILRREHAALQHIPQQNDWGTKRKHSSGGHAEAA